MSASSLILDPTHLALREIHRTERSERFASAAVSVLKAVAALVPVFARTWLGRKLASRIDREVERHAGAALFYKGAAVDLQLEIASTNAHPDAELVGAIDEFLPTIADALNQCRSADQLFRRVWDDPQVASAFGRLSSTFENLKASLIVLRVVATGGSLPGLLFAYEGATTWEAAVAQQRETFNRVRADIRSNDTSDIDPELMHLAERAIAAAKDRSVADDPDWARRLADRSFK